MPPKWRKNFDPPPLPDPLPTRRELVSGSELQTPPNEFLAIPQFFAIGFDAP